MMISTMSISSILKPEVRPATRLRLLPELAHLSCMNSLSNWEFLRLRAPALNLPSVDGLSGPVHHNDEWGERESHGAFLALQALLGEQQDAADGHAAPEQQVLRCARDAPHRHAVEGKGDR